jgi:hypothetical protein
MAKCTSCGSPLCKGCGSPNKFLGGIAASIGAGMTGAAESMGSNAFREKLRSSVFGGAAFDTMQQSQAQQAAQRVQAARAAQARGFAGGTVIPEATINDGVDPVLAGAGVVPPGTMDQANPFEGKTFKIEPASPTAMVDPELASAGIQPEVTYNPPTPGNQMGNAKPLFNAAVQASAEAIYGSPMQRQISVDSPYKMKSPLEGNAFIGAKMAAEKAGESTFEVDGKTFNVK